MVLVPTCLCERRERWREADGRFGAVGPTFSGKVIDIYLRIGLYNSGSTQILVINPKIF